MEYHDIPVFTGRFKTHRFGTHKKLWVGNSSVLVLLRFVSGSSAVRKRCESVYPTLDWRRKLAIFLIYPLYFYIKPDNNPFSAEACSVLSTKYCYTINYTNIWWCFYWLIIVRSCNTNVHSYPSHNYSFFSILYGNSFTLPVTRLSTPLLDHSLAHKIKPLAHLPTP